MPLDSHTRQIVALAWSRILGLPDDSLTGLIGAAGSSSGSSRPARLEVPTDGEGPPSGRPAEGEARRAGREDEQVATFVRLYGASVLYGPRWLLDAARDVDDEVLALESTFIRLGASHRGRSLGEAALYYADGVPQMDRSETLAVSYETDHAAQLESLCPADDVAEAGLSGLDSTFTLVPDDGTQAGLHGSADPVAGSGYEEWQGLIGQVSVLVRPDVRRLGLGAYAAGVAMEEAFTEGLIPQWRARMGHRASQHLADTLGFELAGSQTTVVFEP
ncbi:GNAT family N-acetyltransferase [Micrococcus terreus]|uniref:GNAT family N-acetyltransferase n=1 Tax=Micrococcus TaxID=1269 RepID=UPI0023F8B7A3|nr:GNAT family N-acetyltransferase [Micrococcus terreus]